VSILHDGERDGGRTDVREPLGNGDDSTSSLETDPPLQPKRREDELDVQRDLDRVVAFVQDLRLPGHDGGFAVHRVRDSPMAAGGSEVG
jgi:hypothetical protein